MKYKLPIYNFSEKVSGHTVNFVRVADRFGFWFELKGKLFGDYIIVHKGDVEEAFDILKSQASETLEKLRK